MLYIKSVHPSNLKMEGSISNYHIYTTVFGSLFHFSLFSHSSGLVAGIPAIYISMTGIREEKGGKRMLSQK